MLIRGKTPFFSTCQKPESLIIFYGGETVSKPELLYVGSRSRNCCKVSGWWFGAVKILNAQALWPSHSMVRILPSDILAHAYKDIHCKLFMVAKTMKQPQGPSSEDWLYYGRP